MSWEDIQTLLCICSFLLYAIMVRMEWYRKEILYRVLSCKQCIDNTSIITLRLWNSGNKSLKIANYTTPITLYFGEGTQVLSVNMEQKRSPSVQQIQGSTVVLEAFAFSYPSAITLQVVATHWNGEVKVEAQVKKLQPFRPYSVLAMVIHWLSFCILYLPYLVLLLIFLSEYLYSQRGLSFTYPTYYMLCTGFCAAGMLLVVIRRLLSLYYMRHFSNARLLVA